jgi:type IV pilus assembly protein PilA
MTAARGAGVTLPDLLILLVTLALLLAVVVPELSALHRRSLETVMRAELRQVAAAEDSYFYDHRVYGADPAQLQAVGFRPSAGVQIVVREATVTGWSATATHVGTPVQCALFVRQAAPVGAARMSGETACR